MTATGAAQPDQRSAAAVFLLVLILALYGCARVLEILHTPIPRTAIVALDVLSAMAFAFVDGARRYSWRGTLVFAAICTVVGNIVENIGVTTGFPFGRYYFVELMGPKLFHVPVLLGLAYIGMAYVSWSLALLIAGQAQMPKVGSRILVTSLLAGFIMTSWDLAQDPVWATILHGWIWRDGGPWFGVPVSNYLGWYGTVVTIYLIFALYLRRRSTIVHGADWRPALVFYALCALGNVLQTIPRSGAVYVQDPSGRQWLVADITAASALVSLFIMGGFVVIAWVRLEKQTASSTA
jgi:uncharacterized membrane protein